MPIALIVLGAAVIRLLVWSALPSTSPFGFDEDSYYQVGTELARSGDSNSFWPPMTGWLIAAVERLFHATDLPLVRLAWIAADIGCLAAVGVLAGRIGRVLDPLDDRAAARSRIAAMAVYALYLPAISFAQFTTSETPAALLVLLVALALTNVQRPAVSTIGAGVLCGAAALTRATLLPLLALGPLAPLATAPRPRLIARNTLFAIAAGSAIVGAWCWHNWRQSGAFTIARSGAYNLYIGNGDFYAEDLDLLHPWATPEQIEFRRRFFLGAPQTPALSSDEMERAAADAIVRHPFRFIRRAAGRLARVFAPKTDVLALVGGEARVNIFSPAALLLLGFTNLEWLLVLMGGAIGLSALAVHDRRLATIIVAIALSGIPLCLIAVAKPRYAFVFEPLLIAAAAGGAHDVRRRAEEAWTRHRTALIVGAGFLTWSWIAYVLFAFSSRIAM